MVGSKLAHTKATVESNLKWILRTHHNRERKVCKIESFETDKVYEANFMTFSLTSKDNYNMWQWNWCKYTNAMGNY